MPKSILSDRKDGAGYYYGRRDGDYRQINVRLGPVDLCWRAWIGGIRVGDVYESKDQAEAAAIAWAEANPTEEE